MDSVRSEAGSRVGPVDARKPGRQLSLIEHQFLRSTRVHDPFGRAGHADRRVVEIEAARDEAGEPRARLLTVRNQEDVTAQVEQAAELVAARDRFLRARAGHGGQIARDQADRQEREQRDPVLRVCNREGPDGREEEEVEGEHRRKRRRHGNPQACGGSHEQDDDEKAERDGRRTRCLGPLREHQRENEDARDAQDKLAHVGRASHPAIVALRISECGLRNCGLAGETIGACEPVINPQSAVRSPTCHPGRGVCPPTSAKTTRWPFFFRHRAICCAGLGHHQRRRPPTTITDCALTIHRKRSASRRQTHTRTVAATPDSDTRSRYCSVMRASSLGPPGGVRYETIRGTNTTMRAGLRCAERCPA